MTKIEIQLTVNGSHRTIHTSPHRSLLHILREDLELTGTKDGCSQGDCGACVVVMDGQTVNSCLVLAVQADGSEVTTVEGLAIEGELSHLQVAFAEKWGLQCGYCTPGILMSSYALLQSNPDPSGEEIRRAIAGNLCRCTGYTPIVNSVQHAVALRKEAENGQ